MPLLITFVLGLFIVAGLVIIKYTPHHEKIEALSYAVAFGTLFGISAFDLIPEIVEMFEPKEYLVAVILVAAGVGVLMGLDHFIPEHEEADEENPVHVGMMATIALVIHNMIEGMTVYSIAAGSAGKGMILALGVGLHNIPMGMLIYSSLHHEKKTKRRLLFLLATVSTFFGGLCMMLLHSITSEMLIQVLTCLAFGMIVYIVVFELAPLLRKSKHVKSNVVAALVGFAIVIVSMMLE